jgi:hypothetical protein
MLLLLHNPPIIPRVIWNSSEFVTALRRLDDDTIVLLLWWMLVQGD